MDIIEIIVVGVLIVIMSLIGWTAYNNSQQPTFTLQKDDWECVQEHQATYTTVIPVGKAMIPQVRVRTICDTYKRKSSIVLNH